MKRSTKLTNLKAVLKLTPFLENNQTFPDIEELTPHLQAEAQEHKVNLQALEIMMMRSPLAGRENSYTETARASQQATLTT